MRQWLLSTLDMQYFFIRILRYVYYAGSHWFDRRHFWFTFAEVDQVLTASVRHWESSLARGERFWLSEQISGAAVTLAGGATAPSVMVPKIFVQHETLLFFDLRYFSNQIWSLFVPEIYYSFDFLRQNFIFRFYQGLLLLVWLYHHYFLRFFHCQRWHWIIQHSRTLFTITVILLFGDGWQVFD